VTRRAVPRLLGALLAAAVVATAGLTSPATARPATSRTATSHAVTGHLAASRTDTTTPLQVSIAALTPATIPVRGPVTLAGTITNRSSDTWTSLNAYLLTSPNPIRSRAELARAAASDADTQVGVRRTKDGLYAQVGDLGPGESRDYRLVVDREDLGISGRAGVYWVGVHVLGARDGGRDSIADGRARTFMPLLPTPGTPAASRATTRLALVVPVRQPVRRGGAGRLLGLPTWERSLAPDGRLDRLMRLSARASQPITWVLDPAVLDAVQSVALGNPRLSVGGTGADGVPQPSGSPSSDASGSASPSPSPEAAAASVAARAWLGEFRRQAPGHSVATVPYGDLDVAATLGDDRLSLYQRATALSAATAVTYGIPDASPVVDPVTGYLPEAALARVDASATVLLAQRALPGRRGPVLAGSSIAPGARSPVVVTDARAGSGGPRPNSRYAALEVRQRLLSDAALHAISGRRTDPLVVTMPSDWNPGDAWSRSRFFGGLSQPWLQMVDLPSVAATTSSGPEPPDGEAARLAYPTSEQAAEVPVTNLAASAKLVRTADVFAGVLRGDHTATDVLSKVAMLGSSVSARADPDLARTQTSGATGFVASQMAKVHVEGPPFVMMSGESGPIQVTLANDLDQPVTVGLSMSTPGSRLRISRIPLVTLGAGRRTSIRLEARSNDIGVHAVTLRVVDSRGRPLGSETRFSVRTSHVSTVIWVIIGIGGALLLLAIVVRLYRRLRRRRATPGPVLPPARPTPRPRSADPSRAGGEPV
jgi:hypothetical protein